MRYRAPKNVFLACASGCYAQSDRANFPGPVVVGKGDWGVLTIGPDIGVETRPALPFSSFTAEAGLTIGDETGGNGTVRLAYYSLLEEPKSNIVVGNEGHGELENTGAETSSISAQNILVALGDESVGDVETDGGSVGIQGSLSVASGEGSAGTVDFVPAHPMAAEQPVRVGDDIVIASGSNSDANVCFAQPTYCG